jgi:hypothetical protein
MSRDTKHEKIFHALVAFEMEPSYHEHELSSEQESVFRQLNQLKEAGSDSEAVRRKHAQACSCSRDCQAFLKLKLIKSGLESGASGILSRMYIQFTQAYVGPEYKSLCTSIRDAEEQLEHNQSCLAAADESLVLLAQVRALLGTNEGCSKFPSLLPTYRNQKTWRLRRRLWHEASRPSLRR